MMFRLDDLVNIILFRDGRKIGRDLLIHFFSVY